MLSAKNLFGTQATTASFSNADATSWNPHYVAPIPEPPKEDAPLFAEHPDLDADDIDSINRLAQLTPDQMTAFIVNLQDAMYHIGVEEARQTSKGRQLNIFNDGK